LHALLNLVHTNTIHQPCNDSLQFVNHGMRPNAFAAGGACRDDKSQQSGVKHDNRRPSGDVASHSRYPRAVVASVGHIVPMSGHKWRVRKRLEPQVILKLIEQALAEVPPPATGQRRRSGEIGA
jgi:hypothetical protein